jgi:hypothetical protein
MLVNVDANLSAMRSAMCDSSSPFDTASELADTVRCEMVGA